MANSNPPFDSRLSHPQTFLTNSPFNASSAFKKGYITNTDFKDPSQQYLVNFLYNPSVIELDHSVDTSIPDPSQMSADDLGFAMGPLQQTLSFSLLFDRTYETWDQQYLGDDRAKYGVYVDVKALYDLVGITSPVALQQGTELGGPGSSIARQSLTFTPSGPMRMTPVRAVFDINSVLSYYGYISGLAVKYTHFTIAMIPNRCEVDITMQLMIDTTQFAQSQIQIVTPVLTTNNDGVVNTPKGGWRAS